MSLTIELLAANIQGEVTQNAVATIEGVASLSKATSTDVAFLATQAQCHQLQHSQARVIITTEKLVHYVTKPAIVVRSIFETYPIVLGLFSSSPQRSRATIHPSSVIDEGAMLGEGVSIGPHVIIEKGAVIGDKSVIAAHCHIGEDVHIGQQCQLNTHVSLAPHTYLANQVSIDAGAKIGSVPYNPTKTQGKWSLSGSLGRVMIASQVAIGANTTIDAGAYGDTLVGKGVKIDNLVQIGHDVIIGEHTAIAGCAAIGAGTDIGKHCTIGGSSNIAGNLKLVDDVVLTGCCSVSRSILQSGLYSSGTTAQPHAIWRKNAARFHRLHQIVKKIKTIKQDVDEIKASD